MQKRERRERASRAGDRQLLPGVSVLRKDADQAEPPGRPGRVGHQQLGVLLHPAVGFLVVPLPLPPAVAGRRQPGREIPGSRRPARRCPRGGRGPRPRERPGQARGQLVAASVVVELDSDRRGRAAGGRRPRGLRRHPSRGGATGRVRATRFRQGGGTPARDCRCASRAGAPRRQRGRDRRRRRERGGRRRRRREPTRSGRRPRAAARRAAARRRTSRARGRTRGRPVRPIRSSR